jgi:hypothetical protein
MTGRLKDWLTSKPINGYATNKTLPFINTRIHAKIQKKIDTILKKRGTYVKRKSN